MLSVEQMMDVMDYQEMMAVPSDIVYQVDASGCVHVLSVQYGSH
jgi:hypothetical protein